MPYLTKRRYLPSCVVGALAKVAILFHDSKTKLPTMQQKMAKQYPGWLHVTCCRLWPKFPSGEYENRGRSETKGQVDIYGSKYWVYFIASLIASLYLEMLKGNIPYFCRGTKHERVLGTTRCELQGYSLYLLYDMLLSFEPSMNEGVCTRKKSYWMDHYAKTRSVSDEPEGKKEPCDIQVKSGSKIRNIISQAMRILQVSLWTGDRRNGPINYEP